MWTDLLLTYLPAETKPVSSSLPADLVPVRAEEKPPTEETTDAPGFPRCSEEIDLLSDKEIRRLFYLARWPVTEGRPVCPRCGGEKIYDVKTRKGHKCPKCDYPFSVKVGTAWHSHNLSLRRILKLLYYFAEARHGIDAHAIQDRTRLDLKTIRVAHGKVREAIDRKRASQRLKGAIDVDGIWFWKTTRKQNLGRSNPSGTGRIPRQRCALTLHQRGGPTISVVVKGETTDEVLAAVNKHVEAGSVIVTDKSPAYLMLVFQYIHESVNHRKMYKDKDIDINRAENYHMNVRDSQRVYRRFPAGPYFQLYMSECAYKNTVSKWRVSRVVEDLLAKTLRAPISSRFSGYWQHGRGLSDEDFQSWAASLEPAAH